MESCGVRGWGQDKGGEGCPIEVSCHHHLPHGELRHEGLGSGQGWGGMPHWGRLPPSPATMKSCGVRVGAGREVKGSGGGRATMRRHVHRFTRTHTHTHAHMHSVHCTHAHTRMPNAPLERMGATHQPHPPLRWWPGWWRGRTHTPQAGGARWARGWSSPGCAQCVCVCACVSAFAVQAVHSRKGGRGVHYGQRLRSRSCAHLAQFFRQTFPQTNPLPQHRTTRLISSLQRRLHRTHNTPKVEGGVGARNDVHAPGGVLPRVCNCVVWCGVVWCGVVSTAHAEFWGHGGRSLNLAAAPPQQPHCLPTAPEAPASKGGRCAAAALCLP